MLSDSLTTQELRALLVEPGFLTREEYQGAVDEAGHSGKTISQVILEKSHLSAKELTRLAAEFYHYPFVDLSRINILPDILNEVPQLLAEQIQAVAFNRDDKSWKLAFVNPPDQSNLDSLKKKIGHPITVCIATEEDIALALQAYPRHQLDTIKTLSAGQKSDGDQGGEDVIKLSDALLSLAVTNQASDIHLEPYESRWLVRFRVDGRLHHIADLPKNFGQLLLNRWKLLAKIKVEVRNLPQEGTFRFIPSDRQAVDIRLTVAPLEAGEKVVLRLLSNKNRSLNLADLGLSREQLKVITGASAKKQGLIITCGPTGSGKSATLYGILKKLNREQINIASIEDPVEYDLEGVNQLQVNEALGLTFAEGLKVVLRQDPDIIMISAVRDIVSARLVCNAALTGHLVLTSLDSPDIFTAISRLRELEIENFALAMSLSLIICQRLVRRICLNCRSSFDLSETEREVLAQQFRREIGQIPKRLYRGRGCEVCNQTGYRGRIGLFELLEINEPLRQLVIENTQPDQIKKSALTGGYKSLQADALVKLFAGLTTLDEVYQIIP